MDVLDRRVGRRGSGRSLARRTCFDGRFWYVDIVGRDSFNRVTAHKLSFTGLFLTLLSCARDMQPVTDDHDMRRLSFRTLCRVQKLIRKFENADTPWTASMSDQYAAPADGAQDEATPAPTAASASPHSTTAAFSPDQQTASRTRNRRSIVIYQKSPLLLSTPPSVTRTLAYSHPFISPLSHFVGLLSWTTGDPWESFLLLAGFWFVVCYGDDVVRWAGPLLVVVGLILGMYSRRYSLLSSTVWSMDKAKRERADSGQRSLDEILDTLRVFTDRCEVLLDPFLKVTDFLSTQASPTSATTRPALTTLFLRICTLTPLWILLAVPYMHVVTLQRVILTIGTIALSYHSYPARITRTILWRSRSIRKLCSLATGLNFVAQSATRRSNSTSPSEGHSTSSPKITPASTLQTKGTTVPGVRFTFTLYENQRRWIGAGWTATLFAYERQPWTDEHLNPCPDPAHFELPSSQADAAGSSTTMKWRWVPNSAWRVEGARAEKERSAKRIGGGGGGDESGWVYFDSKWQDGRRVDGEAMFYKDAK